MNTAHFPVNVKAVQRSVHGQDTGMKHAKCGGEIYYDWNVTYDDEGGEKIPSLRCTLCKREIGGDADIQDL